MLLRNVTFHQMHKNNLHDHSAMGGNNSFEDTDTESEPDSSICELVRFLFKLRTQHNFTHASLDTISSGFTAILKNILQKGS